MSIDVYKMVTDRIVEQLENGVVPWKKGWSTTVSQDLAISHTTGKPYSLLNQVMLEKAGEYLTFNQVKKEGGKVKKGAKSKIIVFWKFLTYANTDEVTDGEEAGTKTVPLLKYYNVFHIDDCEGIKKKYEAKCYNNDTVKHPENIIKTYLENETNLIFEAEKSNKAYYSPKLDKVVVPCIEQYKNVSEYYSTCFHELVHSTGYKTRLDRFSEQKNVAFGNEDYSKEELVAELGAAMLVNVSGIENNGTFQNSASYIENWLKALKNDKKLIVSAAAKAEKAVKYILNDTEENADNE